MSDDLIADCELYLSHEPRMMDAYGLACERIRRLIAQVQTLANWKAQQLAVEAEWDAQAVGRLLQVPLGQPIRAAIQPGIEALQERVKVLREALEWYGEQSRLCRLIHSEGDSGRNALSGDGGQRARAALAPTPTEDAK